MTTINIPLQQLNDQLLNIGLNNQNCTIRLFQRGQHIYLDLYIGDTSIILGSKCVLFTKIVWTPTSFIGNLYLYSPNYVLPYNYLELGINVFLYYTDIEISVANPNLVSS